MRATLIEKWCAQVDMAHGLLEAFRSGEVDGRANVAKQISDGNSLREFQELFELPVSEFTQLQRCQVHSLPHCHHKSSGYYHPS